MYLRIITNFYIFFSDLILVVNVETNEYLEPDRDAAVLVTFHSPDVYPDPFSDGTEVKAGNSYNFGLKKVSFIALSNKYMMRETALHFLRYDLI